jgi:glycosyltransferase involved in cell wall biosynthesis
MSNCSLSIVIPAYNEEESMRPLCDALFPVLNSLGITHEIIFVDDGSRDGTFAVLEEIQREVAGGMRIIRLRRNFGQTPAMACGIDHADGDIIITMDADLQNDPRDIPRLLEKMNEGYDIVSGWRKDRKDKAISRKLPSMIANRLIASMTGVRIHDYGCTLKAYRGEVIRCMHLYSDMHRFMAALGALSGARVTEIPVTHHARRYGASKYGISRTIKVLFDVFTVKLILGYSYRPLHLFGYMAILPVIAGLGFGAKSLFLYHLNPSGELTPVVFPTIALLWTLLGELILKLGSFRAHRGFANQRGAA